MLILLDSPLQRIREIKNLLNQRNKFSTTLSDKITDVLLQIDLIENGVDASEAEYEMLKDFIGYQKQYQPKFLFGSSFICNLLNKLDKFSDDLRFKSEWVDHYFDEDEKDENNSVLGEFNIDEIYLFCNFVNNRVVFLDDKQAVMQQNAIILKMMRELTWPSENDRLDLEKWLSVTNALNYLSGLLLEVSHEFGICSEGKRLVTDFLKTCFNKLSCGRFFLNYSRHKITSGCKSEIEAQCSLLRNNKKNILSRLIKLDAVKNDEAMETILFDAFEDKNINLLNKFAECELSFNFAEEFVTRVIDSYVAITQAQKNELLIKLITNQKLNKNTLHKIIDEALGTNNIELLKRLAKLENLDFGIIHSDYEKVIIDDIDCEANNPPDQRSLELSKKIMITCENRSDRLEMIIKVAYLAALQSCVGDSGKLFETISNNLLELVRDITHSQGMFVRKPSQQQLTAWSTLFNESSKPLYEIPADDEVKSP